MKIKIVVVVAALLTTVRIAAHAQTAVQSFALHDVRILEGPFKHAEELNKRYLLELDADRLLAPFLREAGLQPKVESYGNWENSGLDGHIGGHYLTALSLMYAATGDTQVKARLDYMISELKRCQDKLGNGYIGGVPGGAALWADIHNGHIQAGGFDLNKKWVPLYNIHKTYAGLRDAYLIAGIPDAKDMLIKMSDWALHLVSKLSDAQIQDMLRSEHGGLNEVFADVAAITGDDRYLQLAKRFSHQTILEPLLVNEDRLTGLHANTQIPKVIGYKRVADVGGITEWSDAARSFWEAVVFHRSVSIGGNSAHEHFHPTNDFSRMIRSVEGPETCNTYNMLKLTEQLFQTEPDVRYADFYERALFNHILSTQHPKQGGFVYFTPMRPGHYRVYSQPHTSFWCCVGSGLENHSKYGEFIYAHRDDELYVNLFIASQLNWANRGVEIVQHTRFPEEAGTTLLINPAKPGTFTLKLRYPAWVRENELVVSVNGETYPITEQPGSFVSITREWKAGDRVHMDFVMHTAVEQLPDSSNYYSFLYGPIVLAAKTDTTAMEGMFADDSRGGHIAHGPQVPLRDIPIVVGQQETLAALPRQVAGEKLRFALDNLYSTNARTTMELQPFYQLHGSRYILYWPQATPNEVVVLQKQMEVEEQESARLEEITVDRVNGGQQQPESDHAIQFEQSSTGQYEGEQWREAKGWFSYQLRNPKKTAKHLFVRYCDIDRPSDFDILVNGQLVASVRLEGKASGTGFVTASYPLPAAISNDELMTIQFKARPQSITAKVVEVRLLSAAFGE
ncbi:glycoside hydrolase family 127 protein [Parapedobacter tibetensis]|uniref:glycoside hydrolase family 127 protein n=1 Tax=Parapedobacter tibetensis TaxID=2972951 RepID=UPI00214D6111|nr:glycoside hydrolase family 127 protein [Parapedobacter tibetensis]